MDRKVLAERLGECQRRLGHAPPFFIDNLPDEAIILSYVVCSNTTPLEVPFSRVSATVFPQKAGLFQGAARF
jgi:hypothetical protein